MDINARTAIVTGANRGLGRALVDALLDRGAQRIYAAAPDVDLLINNAGAAAFEPALKADRDGVAREFAVNFTGLYDMIRAFAPALIANQGALVNVLTLLSYAPAPAMAGYSASKAAAHSLTLALRPALTQAGSACTASTPGTSTPKRWLGSIRRRPRRVWSPTRFSTGSRPASPTSTRTQPPRR